MSARLIAGLVTLAALLAACDPATEERPAIEPGRSVRLSDAEQRLGAEPTGALGAATRRDLGPLGALLVDEARSVTVLVDGAGAAATICLGEGFAGRTAEGLGLGSSEAEIVEALGQAERDPFAGDLWYRELGVTFHLVGGSAARICLFAPAGP